MQGLATILEAAEAMVFTAMAVFVRVGAIAFLLPGLGERGLPMRVRLGGALALTVLVAPLIRPLVPETPDTPAGVVAMIAAEASAGLIIGLGFRFLILMLQIAGTTAAQHLSISHMFGSGVAPEPEPTIATLLSLGGIVLAMLAGLHVQVVAALAGLYDLLPFGRFPDAGDLAGWSSARIAETFARGVGLAFPLIAISFAYNLALGALSRAMPQLLVALIGVPLLVGLGHLTLYLTIPELYASWSGPVARILADPLAELR